ncbi:transketolase [Trichoderma arundinaceum]|uniref:Transketolase n=1 Tax=Trichoderma arundinaceum TaxID=490622 RepID=A0A395P091_TRIAR|nr:transketolase [Trichoderma arundinaceum]
MASSRNRDFKDTLTQDGHAVLGLRSLLFDICNQNGGGHGGSAIGMAAIGVALWKYIMRYNPSNPEWFDRDRFVLSNGHAAMFLYALSHLVGYEVWTMDELKGYGNAKLNGYTTISHAHPEIDVPGIEVTTGPLGQGIANAVGLAIASKHLATKFNKPGFEVVQSKIYCIVGDGCLMEGVALEAISLAGNLKLDNLVVIYDNNQVTCDGPLDWINVDDTNGRMKSSGWHVVDVQDGSDDVQAIVLALEQALELRGKPVMLNIRTVIGLGTQVAGTSSAHHCKFDEGNVREFKIRAGQDPSTAHLVSDSVLAYFRERKLWGDQLEKNWNQLIQGYEEAYPGLAQKFAERRRGVDTTTCLAMLKETDASRFTGRATREASGSILEEIWETHCGLFGGGADLVTSNKISYAPADVFHPTISYRGRFLRYGVREHAMCGISNGIAAFNPGTFLPITATFFMFYLYAAPSIRMGALSKLPVIHIATHDSFAEGQNGPTHQPVELDSLFRAMPNLTYIRPCDAEEVIGAWMMSLGNRQGPTILSLGRDPVGPIPNTSRFKVARGAYVIHEALNAKLTIVSCGTNLHYAVAAASIMTLSGTPTRVVSAPCLELFEAQNKDYQDSVFPLDGCPIVSVEEYVPTIWARYTTASIGMSQYGYSASNESNYQRFGLNTEGIVARLNSYLKELDGRNARAAGWRLI